MKVPKPNAFKQSKVSKTALGSMLREAREKKGLSLYHVSKRYDLSQPHLTGIESGRIKSPNAKLLLRLSIIYKVKLKDLIMAIPD